jgi:hypothetical protein
MALSTPDAKFSSVEGESLPKVLIGRNVFSANSGAFWLHGLGMGGKSGKMATGCKSHHLHTNQR